MPPFSPHPTPPAKHTPRHQFTLAFAQAHKGFRPGACATYFMQRMHDKPHGWFSRHGKGYEHEGLSFTLDPIYKDPTDPTWRAFIRECNKFALAHGGRVALTQVGRCARASLFLQSSIPPVLALLAGVLVSEEPSTPPPPFAHTHISFTSLQVFLCETHPMKTPTHTPKPQTREMDRETYLACPGQVALKEAPNKRFTTPFFAQFVEKEGEHVEIPL